MLGYPQVVRSQYCKLHISFRSLKYFVSKQQLHEHNISDVIFKTGCNIELDANYVGGSVANSKGAGTSASWMDCIAFCKLNAAKYFTWVGPTLNRNPNSCWCRNVKAGSSNSYGRVFGEVAGCGNKC